MNKTKNLLLPLMMAMGGLPKRRLKDPTIESYEKRMEERINNSNLRKEATSGENQYKQSGERD